MVEAGAVACTVCSEPSDGAAFCGRCGSALEPGAPAPVRPAGPARLPQGQPLKLARPKLPPKSASSDLDDAFHETLPQAGSSEGISPSGPFMPETAIRQDGAPVELPKAGHREPIPFSAPAARPTKAVKRKAPKPPLLPAGILYVVKSALSIAFLLILSVAGVLLVLSQRESQGPKDAAPRLAKRYLSALSITDYASAYYLLSLAAQARCTMDEFRKMRGPGVWTWGNLQVVAAEPDAAEVSYDWSAPDKPQQTVYMFFVRENDRWVVPYNLNLLKRVEDAMRENDPDLALLESQEAVRVNPRDPMARAYLCEAANFRKLYEQAKPECRAALELIGKYPSNLSEQSVVHLKAVAAALEQGKQ
ncbi:MAG: hypothetical protein HY077_15100 [Elusimicrobia bacterium]|nr:hypothetical protein [Elusimicrobiota bacterium]